MVDNSVKKHYHNHDQHTWSNEQLSNHVLREQLNRVCKNARLANPGRHSLSTQNAKSSLLDGRPLVKRPRIFEAAGQVIPRMRHPQSLTTCKAKPGRAKRGSAVTRTSEARCLGRAKRGVTPSLARAAKQARMRFNCRDSTAASKRPWSAGKRALHERDLD